MKALSVKQPWASLIASGRKTLEVRSWRTHYRGPLAIVASLTPDRSKVAKEWEARMLRYNHGFSEFNHAGCVVAIVDLVDVREWQRHDYHASAFIEAPGLFVWELANVYETFHKPIKGQLSLYNIPKRSVVRRYAAG